MLPLFAALLACNPDSTQEGTIVGNPGEATASIAPPSDDLELLEATAELAFIDLEDCLDGSSLELELDEADLLDPEVWDGLPGGTWCGIGIMVDELFVAGEAPGGTFELALEPGFVTVESEDGVVVDGQAFVFELAEPGWLSAELLGLEEDGDEEVVIEADDSMGHLLADTVSLRSAVFEDTDADASVSDEERDAGPVAQGEAREVDVDEDTGRDEGFPDGSDTGDAQNPDARDCGGSSAMVLWLPVLWTGLVGWRRRA